MSKQLNNRKKVLENFLQNPTYSHSIAKLSKVAKSSVGDIEDHSYFITVAQPSILLSVKRCLCQQQN